jgi:hypothetical protein
MEKRERIKQFFLGGRYFRKEFKQQIKAFVIVTLGFTIAFTWRQTIYEVCQNLIAKYFSTNGPTTLAILTSTFITIVSIILIYFSSKLFKEYPDL